MSERRCETCRFWWKEVTQPSAQSFGTCHRYPPQLYAEPDGHESAQPDTYPSETCGEFQPREGQEQTPGGDDEDGE